jgi:hypothetical protein
MVSGHFHRNPTGRATFDVFERHLAPARQCRPFGILSKGFSAPLPRGLVLRCSLGQYRNGAPWKTPKSPPANA